jgi:predicted short-subunit dehydrogenase-like oxidoreductase (DUF2520 family)
VNDRVHISIIGAGNVGWHLLESFTMAGLDVMEVYGRKGEDAQAFNAFGKTRYVTNLNLLRPDADIYFVCVHDDAIEEVVSRLPFHITPEQILVHTSGAKPSSILAPYAHHYGSFWPLQTLTKESPIVSNEMPIIYNGSDYLSELNLSLLAEKISPLFLKMDDDQKTKAHLAAVILNNFVNNLNSLVADYCEHENIDFSVFRPIIKETAMKLDFHLPSEIQTGPAKRNDKMTIEKHLKLLENHEELYRFYCIATESIIKKYHKK